MQKDNSLYAWAQLHEPGVSFLTGPAGSGKTTLINKLVDTYPDQCIRLASTGIAAVLMGGMTIHKFFRFPARIIGYKNIKELNPSENPDDYDFVEMIKAARFLIIDEISMVRSDLMDQIAMFFVKNFPSLPPFGGLKVILVGDMDQLPPVVKEGVDNEVLKARGYNSPYWFDAKCFNWNKEKGSQYAHYKTITLTKVWRQTDPTFISLLNNIKYNSLAPFDLAKINNSCYSTDPITPEDGIVLASTNGIAARINSERMAQVQGKAHIFAGEVKNWSDESAFPVEPTLTLKEGCKIMTVRNGSGYANGTIGTFVGVEEVPTKGVVLKMLLEGADDPVYVPKAEFEDIAYAFNKAESHLDVNVTGTFIQYPVKIAYAITIHKSQGQTFDKVVIDLGQGAFAHGQAYVALSRCRSLSGVKLVQKLEQRDVIYDKRVLDFNRKNKEAA